MLVQYYTPKRLLPNQLDNMLANGWFRNNYIMFRAQLICLEQDVFSVVNIRLLLENYRLSKSLAKIQRHNRLELRTEIGDLSLDMDKEILYERHKHRFLGAKFPSLQEFFASEDGVSEVSQTIFITKELRVYDGEKLVAVSFFDEGDQSMASLLGLFDPDYAAYSLGTYTMLEEIAHAQSKGMKYYYPGYILDGPSKFQYKLRLGAEHIEYYEWKGLWKPFALFNPKETTARVLKQRMDELEAFVAEVGIPAKRMLYPMFALAYREGFEDWVKSSVYLSCFQHRGRHSYYVIEYHWEEQRYVLSKAYPMLYYSIFSHMEVTTEFMNEDVYFMYPLQYEVELCNVSNLEDMRTALLELRAKVNEELENDDL